MERKPRILVVTNKKAQMQHYKTYLEYLGAELTEAENSYDAIRIFNANFGTGKNFDLVMLEYILPGQMTGLALAQIFINLDSGLKVLIFPTAELFDPEVIQECDKIRKNLIEAGLSNRGMKSMVSHLSRNSD